MRKIHQGETSRYLAFVATNSSTGQPLTGLAYNTAGLTAYYYTEGANSSTQITLAAGTMGTWTSGGFYTVDAINMPGLYLIGLPNAVLSSGKSVQCWIQGAANLTPVAVDIELDQLPYNGIISVNTTQLAGQTVSANGTVTFPAGTVSSFSGLGTNAPANWINSAALASNAVTAIQSGLATSSAMGSPMQAGSSVVASNFVAAPTTSQIAAAILSAPANLLATDGSGNVGIASGSVTSIASAVWSTVTETGWTTLTALRSIARAVLGKSSNNGATIRDLNDTKNAITATVDTNGNRTAVTVDQT